MNKISERVIEELNGAASHIRNALSFAPRSENPATICSLGMILRSIEDIPAYDANVEAGKMLQQKLIQMMNGEQPPTL